MTPPAYHLRTNKAIDRFMFIEAIRRLCDPETLAQYTYYGFGGPYLDDFRLLHENFPDMQMISIEKNIEVYKRQSFHTPSGPIKLKRTDMKSFLAKYDARDKKSIFWLDYTGLEYGQFEDFMLLLTKVTAGSIVKITLRASPKEYHDKEELFRQRFANILPSSNTIPPRDFEGFAALLQEMLQIASIKALPSGVRFAYQPISSFCYKDGAGIITLTGIVCARGEERKQVKGRYNGWRFANLHWGKPKRIDVPFLSNKERFHLQKHLPCTNYAGRELIKILGYKIDDDREVAVTQMKQYADFYIQYPTFIRAIF